VLGEDSGLEVAGLGGRPGLASNRWAGPGEDHVEKLLEALTPDQVPGHGFDSPVPRPGRGTCPREARYVCELVALAPSGKEYRGAGVLAGSIAAEPRGSEGFGYDPVFIPEGEERTVAELGDAWKAANSHRARAARGLLETIV